MKSSTKLIALLFSVTLVGCSATTTIDEYRPTGEAIELDANERVVVLGRRDAGHYETDREFIGCIGDKMRSADIQVLPEQEFIDAIYPGLNRAQRPKGCRVLSD